MTDPQQIINAAVSDETPLAFVAQPTVEPIPVVATPPTEPPLPEPTYIPPVQNMPQPKHGSKILMMVLGIFALLGVLGGVGYYGYLQFAPKQGATVAGISQSSCSGCKNGGWLVWRDGACHSTGICGSNVPGKNTNDPNPDTATEMGPGTCSGGTCGCTNANYIYCGGAINKCVSQTVLAQHGGCNGYGKDVYGIAITYGSNPGRTACDPAKVANKSNTQCVCGTTTYCFDRNGSCTADKITRSDGSVVDTGFCGIVGSEVGGVFKEKAGLFCTPAEAASKQFNCEKEGELKFKFNCDIDGCSTSDTACKVLRYTCKNTVGNNSCTDTSSSYVAGSMTSGGDIKFTTGASACGKVEQIDVACGGYIESRTRINPACAESSAPPNTTAPKLVCDSLTKNVADAALQLDSAITFTCAGTVTPTSAGTPSYQFRYMVGTGAWQTMAATSQTASLTPTQCGVQYQVECRACATLNGVKQCDPVWQGVAP